MTSFRTARELRSIIGPDTYQIECDEHFPDDLIIVSPALYGAFLEFITTLTDSYPAVQ